MANVTTHLWVVEGTVSVHMCQQRDVYSCARVCNQSSVFRCEIRLVFSESLLFSSSRSIFPDVI